jgi:hypothetical protein
MEFIKKYQARAPGEGVDPLGFYIAPWGYGYLQVLGQAIEATKSLDDAKLIDYMHKATFKTILGKACLVLVKNSVRKTSVVNARTGESGVRRTWTGRSV